MNLRTLATERDYENAAGLPLHSWLLGPDTWVVPDPPTAAPRASYIGHRLVALCAGEAEDFCGCEIALGFHFAGEPLLSIARDIMRTLLRGLTGQDLVDLECLLSFERSEFSHARTLAGVLCAYQWESQLIVPERGVICNISHDEYLAFYSSDATVITEIKKALVTDELLLVPRSKVSP